MRIGISGSFNPPHNGHVEMIERGLELGGDVVVFMGVNPDKRYMFTDVERLTMLQSIIEVKGWGDRVQVINLPTGQALAAAARFHNVDVLLRGIRTNSDLDYEMVLGHHNNYTLGGPNTLYILPSKQNAMISSSIVRSMIGLGCWTNSVRTMVPDVVMTALAKKYVIDHAMLGIPLRPTSGDEVWSKLEADGSIDRWTVDMINVWAQRDSHIHHNIQHLADVISTMRMIANYNVGGDGCELTRYHILWAIVHDLVMDSGPYESPEMHSVYHAMNMLCPNGYSPSLERTIRMVLSGVITTNLQYIEQRIHDADPYTFDDVILPLADFAILSLPPHMYQVYVNRVRKEYQVSDDVFDSGRADVMIRVQAVMEPFLRRLRDEGNIKYGDMQFTYK